MDNLTAAEAANRKEAFCSHFREHWAFFYFGATHTFAWTVDNMLGQARFAYTTDAGEARKEAFFVMLSERTACNDVEAAFRTYQADRKSLESAGVLDSRGTVDPATVQGG